jgi:hypothetical protein
VTAQELITKTGKSHGVYCMRACVGHVSGHVRGTLGKSATFTHPKTGAWRVFWCKNCGAYWKEKK